MPTERGNLLDQLKRDQLLTWKVLAVRLSLCEATVYRLRHIDPALWWKHMRPENYERVSGYLRGRGIALERR